VCGCACVCVTLSLFTITITLTLQAHKRLTHAHVSCGANLDAATAEAAAETRAHAAAVSTLSTLQVRCRVYVLHVHLSVQSNLFLPCAPNAVFTMSAQQVGFFLTSVVMCSFFLFLSIVSLTTRLAHRDNRIAHRDHIMLTITLYTTTTAGDARSIARSNGVGIITYY
jgi:hypothetical protein